MFLHIANDIVNNIDVNCQLNADDLKIYGIIRSQDPNNNKMVITIYPNAVPYNFGLNIF